LEFLLILRIDGRQYPNFKSLPRLCYSRQTQSRQGGTKQIPMIKMLSSKRKGSFVGTSNILILNLILAFFFPTSINGMNHLKFRLMDRIKND
jgi:hypothetical protein